MGNKRPQAKVSKILSLTGRVFIYDDMLGLLSLDGEEAIFFPEEWQNRLVKITIEEIDGSTTS